MVSVAISKNNGFFEYERVEMMIPEGIESVEDLKLLWAKAIYSEEDLFSLEGAHDVKLYHVPDGEDIDTLNDLDGILQWVWEGNSHWVLDIFGRSLITSVSNELDIDELKNGNLMEVNMLVKLQANEPYVHVGTWGPMLRPARNRSKSIPPSPLLMGLMNRSSNGQVQNEYEDIIQTMHRAQESLKKFKRMGRPVTTHSMQSILLPLAMASPSAIARHGSNILHQGVYILGESDLQKGFVQATRIWFSFDNERTLKVKKRNGSLGLKPVRQQDGWIVVQAVAESACAIAGMPEHEVFLTHVNGVDVSPLNYPSIMDRGYNPLGSFGQSVSWAGNVVPLVEEAEICELTFF
ncbi:hypothetical protein THRCLA_20548 [Thraustotheca clavata]|uniref:Uncharacterized protein n=1 Tax=Thraustotheca clavata TaxID=74557 RepID=A0A1W0A608_9STRA|nr:hypothetical protein THRCLA_20548 [Thraustotheca clavata]